jgi:hypothetical protein
MTTIIVLFNLKPGASIADYEQWAKTKDLPTVNNLTNSVQNFRILRMQNMLGSDAPGPYQYCELIAVKDMQAFFADIQQEHVQAGAKTFNEFADNPQFIVAEDL